MVKATISLVLFMVILCGFATAADNFLIVAGGDIRHLDGYSGGYWGLSDGKIILSGSPNHISWLEERGFSLSMAPLDVENSHIYLSKNNSNSSSSTKQYIIFNGGSFVITLSPPSDDTEFRRLNRRAYKHLETTSDPNIILDYDPLIDGIIGDVSQDTIMDFLARLSGAAPIEIDGQEDTIHTRYSGTEDNLLASRFLDQVFEDYGYSSEFHGFYGGTIRHMASYGSDLGWLVTESSEAYRTTNGGADWILMPDNITSSLWGVANSGPDLVWITGDRGSIAFSDNGGQSFVSQSSGTNYFLFGICMINESSGWIGGDGGIVLHTTDGGQQWTSQSTPTSARLYDICFIDSLYGWACGRNGAVIHTTDGGQSWTTQNPNTGQRLYGIDFTDMNNGWLVGWSGVVRHTTDGGATWTTVNLGNSIEKYHVEFVDPSFGCIVGWNGEIWITDDGGVTWQQPSSGTQADFYGVTFVDDQIGYAGGNGILKKTTDGGITWIDQTTNIESSWRNVIAVKPGTVDPDQQVVICAHFDNRSQQPETNAPGADDNGSGVASVIEAARLFTSYDFEKTIMFCLWTGEEQGLLGSEAYAADAALRGDDIVGVFNLDMIAWDGNGDGSVEFHTGTGNSSIELGNLMSGVVSDYGIDLMPDIITFGATTASDHASFWDNGYSAMLGIEDYSSDFNPYYHTTGDNIDHLMPEFFTEFTKAAVGAAATLAVPDTATTFVDDSELLPNDLKIWGNYPNPFNASTTIAFSIPDDSEVELSVYDLLGREVAALYTGDLKAGRHQVTWNAGEQSSGVYFYRLHVGERQVSGRMTLLK